MRLRVVLVVGLLLAVGAASAGQPIQLKSVAAESLQIRPNLLDNAGFEAAAPGGIPSGWQWDKRNTDSTCIVDSTVAHSGKRSVRFTSTTPFGAHVYGMLARNAPVRIEPGHAYTLSAWVRTDSGNAVGSMTGGGWQWRAYSRPTGGAWKRIWTVFTPGDSDRDLVVRLSVEAPTRGTWVDDLKLEEGGEPTPVEPSADSAAELQALAADQEVQGDAEFHVAFVLFTPVEIRDVNAVAQLDSGATRTARVLTLPAGAHRIVVAGTANGADSAPHMLTFRLNPASHLLSAATSLRFYSPAAALVRTAALRNRLPAFDRRIRALKAKGQDVSYPLATYTVLDNFTTYAREDVAHKEVKRALGQVADMEQMASHLDGDLHQAESGGRLPVVPRWTGARRSVVRSSAFVGPTRTPGGNPQDRPIFFNGYGHFGQVVADMEKWPAYGANIVQIEVGPSALFPTENMVDESKIIGLLHTLDRAKRAGVAVCLLISPHYMPDWALQKWPQLHKKREGFLQYCLHAEEGQAVMRRFVQTLIPRIKDHPALQSICLSNEPVNVEEPCEPGARMWHTWLAARHGSIADLNRLWGTNYGSFEAVPLPDPFGTRPPMVVWMDYIRWNQEFFADWHRMMATAIRRIAPSLPVHAKAMTWTMLNDGDVRYGVDAGLFGSFSQINGNDSVNWYSYDGGEFAQGWQLNAMGHDLQRSVLDAPVFNSENHLIPDRDTRPVPPEHIYTALWQAAAHGQSANTIWVWERAFDPNSDFAGSIMHRPACAEAVGRVNLDLNRAAMEMTAIQQAPPQVQILESVSARVWDLGRYGDCLGKLYTALSFTGLKIGFVTERQLEERRIPKVPILFMPAITHLSERAFNALKGFRGRLVFVGEGDFLTDTDYGAPRGERIPADRLSFRFGPDTWHTLWQTLGARSPSWGIRPYVDVRDAGGNPVWGVEWRSARTPYGTVVNLCNYRTQPVTIRLQRAGRPVTATDVLTGRRVAGPVTLKPLQTLLVRILIAR